MLDVIAKQRQFLVSKDVACGKQEGGDTIRTVRSPTMNVGSQQMRSTASIAIEPSTHYIMRLAITDIQSIQSQA